MTRLRQRMLEDMQLHGLSPQTQRAYLQAIQRLARYYDTPPDQLTEDDLRHYFLYLRDEKRSSRSAATVTLCAIKFLFVHTLRRPWPVLTLVRPRPSHKLPVVLSVDEVWQILAQVHHPAHRVCLSTIYTCGLRLHEGVQLRVEQIDRARMQLLIRHGKGNKDRALPLPPRTLTLLRAHWRTHRNPVWLFPAAGRRGNEQPTATVPVSDRTIERALHLALHAVGQTKPATVHTLRHAWATHLLEAGVSMRVLQLWLGHRSPRTTAIYAHLTPTLEHHAVAALEQLTAGMRW